MCLAGQVLSRRERKADFQFFFSRRRNEGYQTSKQDGREDGAAWAEGQVPGRRSAISGMRWRDPQLEEVIARAEGQRKSTAAIGRRKLGLCWRGYYRMFPMHCAHSLLLTYTQALDNVWEINIYPVPAELLQARQCSSSNGSDRGSGNGQVQ